MPIPARASIAYLLMNIAQKGISFFVIPFITRLLTTHEYGQVVVYLSWKDILGILAMFCLSYGVFNNGMIKYKDKREAYSFSMLMLSNVLTVLCMFAILTLYDVACLNKIISLDKPLLFLMFTSFITEPAYLFWLAKNRFEYQYKVIAFFTVSMMAIANVSSVLLAYFIPTNKLYTYLFTREAIFILFYLIIYLKIGNNVSWKLNTSYWRFALTFNTPLIIHYLSKYVLNSSDRIMISSLVDNSAAAKYGLAYAASQTVFIIWNSLENSMIPFIYKKVEEKRFLDIGYAIQPISIGFALLCVAVCFIAPELMHFLATEEYMESIFIVPVIVGGIYYSSQYSMFSHILYAKNKPNYVMIASIVSSILNILLNYIFIPRYGYYAAAVTTFFCFWLQAVMDYLILCHVVKERIYSRKFIILMTIFFVIISYFMCFIYRYNNLRLGLIIILLIIIIKNKMKIISFVNDNFRFQSYLKF